jgi:hypothetical protein
MEALLALDARHKKFGVVRSCHVTQDLAHEHSYALLFCCRHCILTAAATLRQGQVSV